MYSAVFVGFDKIFAYTHFCDGLLNHLFLPLHESQVDTAAATQVVMVVATQVDTAVDGHREEVVVVIQVAIADGHLVEVKTINFHFDKKFQTNENCFIFILK